MMGVKVEFIEDKKDILVQSSILSKILDVTVRQITTYVNQGMPFIMVSDKQRGYYVKECLEWVNLKVKKQTYLENISKVEKAQSKNFDLKTDSVALNEVENIEFKNIFNDLVSDLKGSGMMELALIKDLSTLFIKKNRLNKFETSRLKKEILKNYSIDKALENFIAIRKLDEKYETLAKSIYFDDKIKELLSDKNYQAVEFLMEYEDKEELEEIGKNLFDDVEDYTLEEIIISLEKMELKSELSNAIKTIQEIGYYSLSGIDGVGAYIDEKCEYAQDLSYIAIHTKLFFIDLKKILSLKDDLIEYIDAHKNLILIELDKKVSSTLINYENHFINQQSKILKEIRELQRFKLNNGRKLQSDIVEAEID